MLLIRLARSLHRRDEGAALAAVIGLMAVMLLLTTVVATSVIGSLAVTTGTRAGVQSQAAAEAGIAAARAGLIAGTCGAQPLNAVNAPTYQSAAGATPRYVATVWHPNGAGQWLAGCPVGLTTTVRILSTGYAGALGVAGAAAGDTTNLEAILSSAATPTSIQASGPAVYAYSSSGFGGGGTLYSVDGDSPNVMVKTGNVICDGGSNGISDLVVDNGTLLVKGGCGLTGNAWSSLRTTIDGGATVGGNVVAAGVTHGGTLIAGSVWSTLDVTINGGGKIQGNATGASLSVTNGTLNGDGWIYGLSTLNWGGYLNGHLTTKALSKPNNASYDSQYVKGTITVLPGGLGSSSFSTPPARPVVPGWVDFAYDASKWVGFTPVVMSGTCSYAALQAVVTALTGPGLIDARLCTNGIAIAGSDKVKIASDVAIIANKFALTNGGGFKADSAQRLWLITSDEVANRLPTCPVGGSFTISGDFDFSTTLSTMLYTPCAVNVGTGIDTFRGQLFVGAATIDGGAHLGYDAIGLPGVNLNDGTITTVTATEANRVLSSLRNVQAGN